MRVLLDAFQAAARFSKLGVMSASVSSQVLVGVLGCILAVADAKAQQPSAESDLAGIYSRGMSEFQKGDYVHAANDLEALVAKAEFAPTLEPVFYSLGCAYFNAADYGKAVIAFQNYQKTFPTGPHLNEALFAGRALQFVAQKLRGCRERVRLARARFETPRSGTLFRGRGAQGTEQAGPGDGGAGKISWE